ncbi:MAG TPA: MTH938/NDUFAF3 family protein [Gammaproteobacteria bacterium]|nr:MTH938/NDUFAF3 family protein [Gammaproteobacteria bacterium]
MQLTRDTTAANIIRAWEPGRIRVAERWIAGHVIVTPDRIVENWRVETPASLRVEDLGDAIAQAPEIVLLGTGTELAWPDADLIGALAAHGIGLEIMSTPAACRTFSVLVQEQRRVAAALFNFAAGATGAR